MCAPTDYCRIHGYQPCQCTGANVQPQQQSVPRRQQRRRGTASTSSYSQSSPQDTSSSGTAANTVDPTRRSTPVVVSAFSPLAQSLERYKGSDSGCGTQDPADEEIRRTDLSQSSLRPTAQNRFQLLQRFIDLHMGTSGRARVIFQYETIQTGEPGTVTTTAAMDTLCIAQLATSFGDNQLKKESKLMYSRAMRLLGMKIQSFGGAKPSPEQLDDVIGAIHALTASSWFRCVDAGGLDWTRHAQALLRVLNVYGWEAIPQATRNAFRYNWKYRAFWDGISRRIKVIFPESLTGNVTRDLANTLLELGFRTCELLEKSDEFLQAGTRRRPREIQVLAILTEIGALVALLKKWHLAWTKSSPPRPRQKIVSTKHFAAFRGISKELWGVFPTASDFSQPANERDYRILNICLLNLDQTIMDIHAAFPQFCEGAEMEAQLKSAEYDAATCASELCSVVPWSAQPSNMAFAAIHSMQTLQYASRYYRQHGKLLQLEWCQQVTESLTQKYGIQVKLWEDSDAFVSC